MNMQYEELAPELVYRWRSGAVEGVAWKDVPTGGWQACTTADPTSTAVKDTTRDGAVAKAAAKAGTPTRRPRRPRECDAEAKRGTGTGACEAPLDEHGNCPRAASHI